MNDRQMENKIRQAFSAAAPDKLDDILRCCDPQKGAIIMMSRKKSNRWAGRLAAVAAALAFALCGFAYSRTYAVASTVSLDVNPSIQIDVNRRQRVLEVLPLNEDGRTVVGEMDFSGADLEVTVNALIGSMLRQGYLSEMTNAILVSVNDNDHARAEQLQQQLSAEIDALLQTDAFSGAVLSQTVSADETLEQLAQANNITPGKAQLVRQMVSQNSFYSAEELAALSINDLYLLNSAVDNVSSTGKASEKAYIGREAALEAATAHAGVTAPSRWEAELDYDKGRMVYEVEFFANNGEYDYELDARTGEVLWNRFEPAPKITSQTPGETPAPTPPKTESPAQQPAQQPTPEGLISSQDAIQKALEHAGLHNANPRVEWELDTDRGVQVYELEFQHNRMEYDYEIDAHTGQVLKYEKERDD